MLMVTGGGIFRKMYGDFLVEAAEICENSVMYSCGNDYLKWG